MKPKSSPTKTQHKEGVPKLTSVGNGRRKAGSFKKQRTKPRRGQGR
jgi:hypothetical protein